MPKIITPKDKDHWLQMKAEDISSTETAALFGLSPYNTEFELYHQKSSGEVTEIADNERMYCGRMIEDTIAKMVGETYGIKARRLKTYFRHDDEPRMSSSFDYEIVGDNSDSLLMQQHTYLQELGAGLLEIKNVDALVFRSEWDDNEAPPHIEVQVQHQMEVSNREWTMIAALVGGNKLHIIIRLRDKDMGTSIRNRVAKFWHDVEAGNEPKPDYTRDASFICSMYDTIDAKAEPMDITDDISLRSLVITFKELRDRYNELEKATSAIRAEVFHRVGDVPMLFSDDGIKVTMTKTKNTLPQTITEDMVGTEIGGKQGYRQFRVSIK